MLLSFGLENTLAEESPLLGDVNGDGVIDIADGVGIVNYIVGKTTSAFLPEVADVDGDGSIDIADAVQIVNLITGKLSLPDTVKVLFQRDTVLISGAYRTDRIHSLINGKEVRIISNCRCPFVCVAEGECADGRLVLEADTCCTLTLNNLTLNSNTSAAICFAKKQKATINLPEGTSSVLSDAAVRSEGDSSSACLYSKGTVNFVGKGELEVTARYGHAIASSKNISIEECTLTVVNTIKNGLHCDKFTMNGGTVRLHLQQDASKGIKAKDELTVMGGNIVGDATGGINNNNGDLSYSSLIKCDGTMTFSDGNLILQNCGNGGRCISVDKDLIITGGTMTLICQGDGGKYINTQGEQDYYTPKCITVDDSLKIESGEIACLSTGLGGKGIVAGKIMTIGHEDEKTEQPIVSVETKGECIVNDEDEDKRFGCPKGIKSDSLLVIHNGTITVTTAGMGGEGIESKHMMSVYGGKLECNTYDDGINVVDSIEISGGQVYCNSENNDGIDSNGSICIAGGIVAAVNQQKPNESLDAEQGKIYLRGGIVFGIGSGPVEAVAEQPYYSTPAGTEEEGVRTKGFILTGEPYVWIEKENKVLMAMRNMNKAFRTFITVMLPSLVENEPLAIFEGEAPNNAKRSYFGGKLLLDAQPCRGRQVADIQVKK